MPGAGSRLIDAADCVWPGSGAVCTDPRLAATYVPSAATIAGPCTIAGAAAICAWVATIGACAMCA